MKKISSILLCTLLYSCSTKQVKQEQSIAVTILQDVTDQREVRPQAQFVLSLFDFKGDKQKAGLCRIAYTTDLVVNPTQEAYIPTQSQTDKLNEHDDPYHREKQIKMFYAQVKTMLSHKQIDTVEYNHSEVFRTIVRELTELQKQQATKRYLLWYSDLLECSDIAKSYNRRTIDTGYIQKAFLKQKNLPDSLLNTVVYVLYQPTGREDDKRFMAMYHVYEKLLTDKGAIVELKTNI
jgi:dimeric dUTPase (all-alpha-NTP-PPase superfamily)